MKKLLQFFDGSLLKLGVCIAIIFTALYPKLPSIYITHTWVYIRLEDFLIAGLVIIWGIQFVRKKVSFPLPVANPILLYWVIGFLSLLSSLIFIGPHLANFFPKLAVLQYLRRIEYMILFFISFTSLKTRKDILQYLSVLCLTVFGVVLYGFGQKYYVSLWHLAPKFFEKNPFCFPAFLTGNEEFAKGTAFCLSDTSRITSTFGGHYDLAAYLVFVIPVLIAAFIAMRQWYWKLITGVLSIFAIALLNFTASRVSFASYLVGVISMLIFFRQKKWIIPVIVVSFVVLISFNGSTLQRILKTIQPVQVVTIRSGTTALPPELQKIIIKTKQTEENQTPEKPPPGTITIGSNLNKTEVGTNAGAITTVVTDSELAKLQKLQSTTDDSLSTISGSLLVQKAYALDISFTTRFQAEWPRDWAAFLSSPLLGTGYSSLTLASDNDYLRALGETGILGFFSFLLIFIVLGIYMKQLITQVQDTPTRVLAFGLSGGVIGLLANASLIDVFEASKVAEPLWILLGIGIGAITITQQTQKRIDYKTQLLAFFTSNILIFCYMLCASFIVYTQSIRSFFLANDFMLLKWAASFNTTKEFLKYLRTPVGYLNQPLSHAVMYFLYTLFSFQPEGYHIILILLQVLISFGIYVLIKQLSGNKLFAFIGGILYFFLPNHIENLYWLSTIAVSLATVFLIYATVAWISFRKTNGLLYYSIHLVLALAAVFSYQYAGILPVLIVILDIYLGVPMRKLKSYTPYIPYVIVFVLLYILQKKGDTVLSTYITADFGFTIVSVLGMILFTLYLKKLFAFIYQRKPLYAYGICSCIVLVFIVLGSYKINQEATDWKKAGDITRHTLAVLLAKYSVINAGTDLYFINVPVQKGNALIFPAGLPEAVWFIFHDPKLRIYQTYTVDEANNLVHQTGKKSYFFLYDEKGNVKQIK